MDTREPGTPGEDRSAAGAAETGAPRAATRPPSPRTDPAPGAGSGPGLGDPFDRPWSPSPEPPPPGTRPQAARTEAPFPPGAAAGARPPWEAPPPPAQAKPRRAARVSRHKAAPFAWGLLLGAVVAGWSVLILRPGSGEAPRFAGPAPQAMGMGAPAAAACPAGVITPSAGANDGRIALSSDLSRHKASETASFTVAGLEAAAGGRPRDAEAAFLMACRLAEKYEGGASEALADAKYQLGRHYANLALGKHSSAASQKSELLSRAELMYSASLQRYLASHGDEHEKSRFASAGLAQVWQQTARTSKPAHETAEAPPPAAAASPTPAQASPAPAVAAAPARPEAPAVVAAAPAAAVPAPAAAAASPPAPAPASPPIAAAAPAPVAPAPATAPAVASAPPIRPVAPAPLPAPPAVAQAQPPAAQVPATAAGRRTVAAAPARPRPSFDCRNARSTSERLICADPQLAQMDRDLGRLYARAKSSAADPEVFKRQNDYEWRMRESICRDRECLLRWYAQRRVQLTASLPLRTQPPAYQPPGYTAPFSAASWARALSAGDPASQREAP